MTKIFRAPKEIFSFANGDGGLPYHSPGDSMAEPAMWTLFACLAHGEKPPGYDSLLDWCLKLQMPNGSIPLRPGITVLAGTPLGVWLTPHFAILTHHLGKMKERDAAIQFLVNFRSEVYPVSETNDLDSTLVGWPWVNGTFSWVEPTAWAMLAMKFAGLNQHPRYLEGQKLLKNRCLPQCGWNYGNKTVYNNTLIPFCDTTSIALLALDDSDPSFIASNLDFLEKEAGAAESLYALAWASVCLERYGKNVLQLNQRIHTILESMEPENLNLAHLGLAFLALSGRRILTS